MMQGSSIFQKDENLAELKQNLILQTKFDFYYENQKYPQSIVYLFQKVLIIKIQKPNEQIYFKLELSFQLIFQIAIKQTETQSEGNLSMPTAIKFELGQSSFYLKNPPSQQDFYQWREQLEKKLNQRGFHELFHAIRKIGKGSFASVYLVMKNENRRNYAVKAFSKEAAYCEERGKQSIIQQIKIMREFNHKNLMKIFGVYESKNSIYICAELLSGGQLYDLIKNKHKFSPCQIRTIMKGILEGIAEMHSRKIMHRDLKPQNIILRKESDFDCVIADFGLAEYSQNAPYNFVRCGTPGYVAPEIINLKDQSAKYDPICDLFSIGVIFHILIFNKSPFPGKEYDEVVAQNRLCKISFNAPQYSRLPEQWLNLLKRLLQKDPNNRISAEDALKHEFFKKQSVFLKEQKKSSSVNRFQSNEIESKDFINKIKQCPSPLMLTRDNSRKNPQNMRDDSCLKFKMKQNVMNGKVDQVNSSKESINSPQLNKKKPKPKGESRFKKN